jgi:hypothetical protein
MPSLTHAHWLLAGACVLAAFVAVGACTQPANVHDTPDVRGQPCVNCHAQAFLTAQSPTHVGVFPQTCGDCHNTRAWIPANPTGNVNHPWFLLANKHASVACAACHAKGYQPGDTPQDCVGCHQANYDSATNPPHTGFPTTCNTCHNDTGWSPATASGSSVTSHPWFPLANKHANVACATCHTKGYKLGDTPQDCVGCHQANYDSATNPPHTGLPTTCNGCHNDLGWSPSTFVHPWTLDGTHATTPCVSCHTGSPPRYAGTPTACVGCHLANFQASTFPGHSAFPQTCADCHSTTAWTPASGGVHPEANFPIATGSHANAGIICTDCHISALGSPVQGQNTDCIHCHLGAHEQPAIDTTHVQLKVANYPGPNASSPNFCLSCHPKG